MDNKIMLDSIIHLAVAELDSREYEEYLKDKKRGVFTYPDERVNNAIDKIIIKEEQKDKRKIIAKIISKTAVCFAIFFSCLSCSFLTAEAVRESVATVAIEWYEKFTRTTITADNVPTELPEIELGYIPEGFTTEYINIKKPDLYYHKLIYGPEKSILITMYFSDNNTKYNSDNERLNYYTININGQEAIWVYDSNYNNILINIRGISVRLSGNIGIDELIHIYENIKFL